MPLSLGEHLKRRHGLKHLQRLKVEAWVQDQHIATTVLHPTDYTLFIPHLQHLSGFKCNKVDCRYRTGSERKMRTHCSHAHGIDRWTDQRALQIYSRVTLQWLFSKTPQYFIVDTSTESPSLPSSPPTSSPSTRYMPSSSPCTATYLTSFTASGLAHRFSQISDDRRAHYRQIGEPQHVSELTPWLKKARFHQHLAGIDGELIKTSHSVPRKVSVDGQLWHIAQSVDRVLGRAYELIGDLHHVDARTINTFQVGTVSQDPMQQLQNRRSFDQYVEHFQSLVCFYIRVVERDHFGRPLFIVSDTQRTALDGMLRVSNEVDILEVSTPASRQHQRSARHQRSRSDDEYVSSGTESDEHINDQISSGILAELDQHTFDFLTALVQQKTASGAMGIYASAIISFCAVRASRVHSVNHSITWVAEGLASGIFSRIIYCCQLVILQLAQNQASARTPPGDIGEELPALCRQWIVNDTRGPVSALNDWRLFAMKVGSTTVPEGLVVWDDDGRSLTYGEVRYGLDDLHREMQYCWQEADRIFSRDLCLGFTDVPTYALRELQDNWSNMLPGYSFVDDIRNAAILEGHDQWLTERIYRDPARAALVFHLPSAGVPSGQEKVRSVFATQYQLAVIRFLELMLVLVHKGSGQPARRPEFLGTRWCNTGLAPRNLRLHSGHVLFVLTYHKSMHRTHASRSPVRFLPPLVGQRLVQFLILIQSFRRVCAADTQNPPAVGEYIWSDGATPWVEDRMSRTVETLSQCSIGRRVNVKSWRQICTAIAVKKFSGMHYEADTDLPGNHDDMRDESMDTTAVTLPASFHAQTAHGSHTGNRAYGGSVNFASSLTDAGVQVYLWTSQLWWTLFETAFHGVGSVGSAVGRSGKRARPVSMAAAEHEATLLKRVAYRVRPPRAQRRFGREMVQTALRRLYRDPTATFRTARQQEMVELVAARHAEVVVILATGGGKSLSFMVPLFLPQSGTTVVVVPLVALKSDLVRRCYAADIQYSIWDGHTSAERYGGTPLMFVAAEQAVKVPFQQFLGRLDGLGQLDRIVFDECHLILTASTYRPKMTLLRQIRAFRCSVVFLTATLPPVMMREFQTKMLLEAPRVVRDITFRSDLHYDIHRQQRAQPFEAYTAERVQKLLEGHFADDVAARIIVYVRLKETARTLAELIGCEYYYSDSGSVDEKEQVVARWRAGTYRVIVATSAFGTGVDYAHVRMVVHHHWPRNVIDFGQEVGRAGRDGQGGTSMVVLPRDFDMISDAQWAAQWHQTDTLQERVMLRYVGHNRCLGAVLSRFFDGVEHMRYCQEDRPRCGACRALGLFNAATETDDTYYWDQPREATTTPDREQEDGAPIGPDERWSSGEDGDENEAEGGSEDIMQGSRRHTASVRMAAQARAQYLERCAQWRGTCLICQLLAGGQGTGHSLDQCRSVQKWAFITVKRETVQRQGRGWIRPHTACWHCGQPPTVCDGLRGVRECEFRDMVFPAAWAMYTAPNLWGSTLAEISGRAGGFPDMAAWMRWLGEECEMFQERSIQAVRMLDWLLQRLEEVVAAEAVSVRDSQSTAEFVF